MTAPRLNQSPQSPGASGKGELSCPQLLEARRVCSEKAEEWRFLSDGEAAPKLSLISARQLTNQELSGGNLKVSVDLWPEGHDPGWTKLLGAASFFGVPSLILLFSNVLTSDGRSQTSVLKKLYRPWLRGLDLNLQCYAQGAEQPRSSHSSHPQWCPGRDGVLRPTLGTRFDMRPRRGANRDGSRTQSSRAALVRCRIRGSALNEPKL